MTTEEKAIEEAAQLYCENETSKRINVFENINQQIWFAGALNIGFETGAKSPEAKVYWQKGMYSEEEVICLIGKMIANGIIKPIKEADYFKEWFEQNKKK